MSINSNPNISMAPSTVLPPHKYGYEKNSAPDSITSGVYEQMLDVSSTLGGIDSETSLQNAASIVNASQKDLAEISSHKAGDIFFKGEKIDPQNTDSLLSLCQDKDFYESFPKHTSALTFFDAPNNTYHSLLILDLPVQHSYIKSIINIIIRFIQSASKRLHVDVSLTEFPLTERLGPFSMDPSPNGSLTVSPASDFEKSLYTKRLGYTKTNNMDGIPHELQPMIASAKQTPMTQFLEERSAILNSNHTSTDIEATTSQSQTEPNPKGDKTEQKPVAFREYYPPEFENFI